LNNKGIRLTKAKTNKNNPDKLAKATDGLPAAPVAQVSNPSDARETLENGSVAGIGRYLHDDVAPLLRLIAERRHQPKQEVTRWAMIWTRNLNMKRRTCAGRLRTDIQGSWMTSFGNWRDSCGRSATCSTLRVAANSNSIPCGAGRANPKIKSKPFSKETSTVI
jgi:hypothetical protein